MAFINAGFAVPPFTYNDSNKTIALGTRVPLSDGGVAVFCQAGSEISQYNALAIRVGYTAIPLTTAAITEATGTGLQVGFAQTSIASGNYFWAQLSGRPVCMLAANCADYVRLFTTSTPGVLDDAVVSIGGVAGTVSKTTISNATAVTLMVPTEAFIELYSVQA